MTTMPTVPVASLASRLRARAGSHGLMVYATVIGADLGPKITPIGA